MEKLKARHASAKAEKLGSCFCRVLEEKRYGDATDMRRLLFLRKTFAKGASGSNEQ
jgi:hypothetical protein